MTALRTAPLGPTADGERPRALYRKADPRPGRLRAAAPPPVSDADLLEACRAGAPRARQLYARACEEWRERHQAARQAALQPEAELIVRDALAEAAGTAWMAVLLRRARGPRNWRTIRGPEAVACGRETTPP